VATTDRNRKPAADNGGNVFTRKLGPLPGYAWVILGVGVLYVGQKVMANRASTGVTQEGEQQGQAGTTPYSQLAGYAYPGGYGAAPAYSSSSNDNSMLSSFLSILAAQGAAGPSPGNPDGPAGSPGNTGNPAIQPGNLPRVDATKFPVVAAPNTAFSVLGSITQPGGIYTGKNVAGGVPVYAFYNGQWQQNFNSATLPVGTQLAIPTAYSDYIGGQVQTGPI
jgi:hypothetical protein